MLKTESKRTDVPDRLLEILFAERGQRVPALREEEKADVFRALCNVRPPRPIGEEFLRLQDRYLVARAAERGVVRTEELVYKERIALWQGDITRLDVPAIVNACNSALLGCFQPLHGCIDNAIHSAAGVQLRLACAALTGGREEPNGCVKVTEGYNLPCRYVFHTVGPIVRGRVNDRNRADLKSCYVSCMEKAAEMGLSALAFCCISAGEYHFPKEEACRIAVETVREELQNKEELKVIFNVFTDEDKKIYERRLYGSGSVRG